VFIDRHAGTVSARGNKGLVGWLVEVIGARSRQNGRQKQMELLETLSLGGKRHLMLVSCGGGRFLVGANGDASMTIISIGATESCRPVERPKE
jgi:flagellar biogenesis protein FliO